MRPVNLIPSEKRRGGSRLGGRNLAGYGIVGFLVLILVVVSAVALFDRKTNDRQAEVASLEAEAAAAQAEASSLSSFISFKQLHDARVTTIDSLAKSRFDWERVMRELSLVIPDKVWLTNLTGTASPAATVANAAGLALRGEIDGPALELTGCAQNQRTVARLIAAINDIDGVTRVLVSNSAKAEPSNDAESAPTEGGGKASPVTDCAIRPSYPTFELVAAFDGVAPPADAAAGDTDPAVPTSTDPAAAPATPETTAPEPTTTTPTTDDGGVSETSAQNEQQQNDTAATGQDVNDAAKIPSGGGK